MKKGFIVIEVITILALFVAGSYVVSNDVKQETKTEKRI
jgi:hypothetical protein